MYRKIVVGYDRSEGARDALVALAAVVIPRGAATPSAAAGTATTTAS